MNKLLPLLFVAAIIAIAGCTTSSPPATQPSVTVTSAPATAVQGTPTPISWRVEAPAQQTTHTSVHFGPTAVPNPTKPSDYPSSSAYLSGALPASFTSEITPGFTGTLSYRAHAILADGTHVWSVEATLQVEPLPPELNNDLAAAEQELDEAQ